MLFWLTLLRYTAIGATIGFVRKVQGRLIKAMHCSLSRNRSNIMMVCYIQKITSVQLVK